MIETDGVLTLLREIAGSIAQMEAEAEDALVARDTATYKSKLRDKGYMLVMLPALVQPHLANISNDVVRERIQGDANIWADYAQRWLDADNTFGLSTLLIDKGSKVGDKNQLEQLIKAIEGEK